MPHLDNATAIALTTIIGIFITIIVAIFVSGVDGTLKLLGAVGTLFGALVGAIGAHYFSQKEIRSADSATKEAVAVAQDYQARFEEIIQQARAPTPLTESTDLDQFQAQVTLNDWSRLNFNLQQNDSRLKSVINSRELQLAEPETDLKTE